MTTLGEIVALRDAVLSRITAIEYIIENNADYNAQKSVFALCAEIRRVMNNFAMETRIKDGAPIRRLESADGKFAVLCYRDDQIQRAQEKILCV